MAITHNLVAGKIDAGTRLDRYLSAKVPELSRTRIQELIEAGLVLVDGAQRKGSYQLRGGETITVEAQARPAMRAEAETIPLEILYEDDDLIAVNKRAGMTVHAGAGNIRGTLVNALLGLGQNLSQGGDPLRPGIVHRIDKETSGVILVAKNDFAHARLAQAFQKREVKKTYIALVEGRLKEAHGRIELPIGRDLKRRTRMAVYKQKSGASARRGNARHARTDWKTLAELDGTTLAEIQLHTGRTHQIRVHFAAIKHPVVGDALYGAAERLRVNVPAERGSGMKDLGVTLNALGRNFLHAAKLGFSHPRTGEWTEVRAPLPRELHEFLETLATATGESLSRIDAALAPYL